jgi:CheY-like chemotaxis protein
MNLVINARDAMPTGGKLLIETRDVSFGLRDSSFLPPGDYVVMSTTDTGTGISADVLSQIFEPFFTTKELHMGSGLGLSTVEGIVKQSGGSVQVRSRVGVGTTFDIYLPRARELPAPPRYAAESAPPRELAFETVLGCDDDEGVRQLIADVLGFRAYSVLQANSGAQALELSKRHPDRIHLLITDLVMPGLSGVALARELRARDPSLKVLYISGYSDDPAGLTATLGEHAHFLAKPFLPGDLTQAVCSILEKR